MIGSISAVCTSATLSAEDVICVIAQAAPTPWINIPRFETRLASQIRRAAVSLTNNIAEGHGRYHYLEQIKFCLNSRGSLEELLDDLNVCVDESYLSPEECAPLKNQGWRVHQLLNGFICEE